MKKLRELCTIALVFIISTNFAFHSIAESNGQISIESGSLDSTGVYQISVVLSKNTNIEMIQFTLGYDSEKLELLTYAVGSAFSGKTAPTISNPSNGIVCFVWDALSPLNEGGTLLTLDVKPRTNASGVTQVWFNYDEDFVFADADYQQVLIEAQGAEIDLDSALAASPLIAATPNADIVGYNNGLNLSSNELSLSVGDEETLTVSGDSGTLAWSSSNESVATVENGRVTAFSSGTAIILVSSADGTKEATCVVFAGNERIFDSANSKNTLPDSIRILIIVSLACIVMSLLIITLKKRNK